ncbi:GNAT family N-acetyltransferase [Flavobacterium sp.]|jgi:GNAT superfamily N-acetyltransferase|uniref:GNAT family N-acetyltransferase n=1 Tax=Flavobacterium sp. TaxID=239 RepID=UPI0022CB08AB|nr:GNAT family N-acetyltransferase [Flavobacterium sp.]MCZ8228719.1 GNAT family N-acetyltransferase [Flavobacterium sp.]
MNIIPTIERVTLNDAVEISDLIINNASFYLKSHYSDAQWSIFKSYYSIETIQEKIQKQQIFCAKIEDKIVGTIALDHDYIVGFYTHIAYANKGIGSKLLSYIEKEAQQIGHPEIYLASSPVGLDFYLKFGWQIVEELEIDYLGVPFVETIMKKRL